MSVSLQLLFVVPFLVAVKNMAKGVFRIRPSWFGVGKREGDLCARDEVEVVVLLYIYLSCHG